MYLLTNHRTWDVPHDRRLTPPLPRPATTARRYPLTSPGAQHEPAATALPRTPTSSATGTSRYSPSAPMTSHFAQDELRPPRRAHRSPVAPADEPWHPGRATAAPPHLPTRPGTQDKPRPPRCGTRVGPKHGSCERRCPHHA